MHLNKKEREKRLEELNFVFLEGGGVSMGTKSPIPCQVEKFRMNETPIRIRSVKSFWICKFTVSNIQFEKFNPRHHRPSTSDRDDDPVTDITYGEATNYAKFLSEKSEIRFDLPTEKEWVFAAAPFGWEFFYQKEASPNINKTHFFNPDEYHTLAVNDSRYEKNVYGLVLMGGNVVEMTKEIHKAKGHNGAIIDGSYYMGRGGGFGHCKLASGSTNRRILFDIASRSTRVGFRLISR